MSLAGSKKQPSGDRRHEKKCELSPSRATARAPRQDDGRPSLFNAEKQRYERKHEKRAGSAQRYRLERLQPIKVLDAIGVAE